MIDVTNIVFAGDQTMKNLVVREETFLLVGQPSSNGPQEWTSGANQARKTALPYEE
jgi:hypothetical protein